MAVIYRYKEILISKNQMEYVRCVRAFLFMCRMTLDVCRRVVSCRHFTRDSLRHYLVAFTDMELNAHKVAALGYLPGRGDVKL